MSDIIDTLKVTAVLNPFNAERVVSGENDVPVVPHGLTITEILEVMGTDPAVRMHFHIFIGDQYISPDYWRLVKPRAGAMISIRAFLPPAGGDAGGGGKDILRTVAIIAVAAAALAFGPALGGALGLTGAFAASVGQAIIGIGGMLLVNALVPPRSNAGVKPSAAEAESPTKFIEGATNRLGPFEPVDVPFGRHRIVPKLAAQTYTELVGDDQYLRMLFHCGIGPVAFSLPKIGDTDLEDFDGVDIEYFQGFPSDGTPTLYPATVAQDNFQIELKEVDGYTIRTSALEADELSIDILFPEGLITVLDDGTRTTSSVTVQLEYSVAGANIWQAIPVAGGQQTFPLAWSNSNGTAFNVVTFTQQKTAAIRHGITWRVPSRGQYDIRIKRASADTVSENVRDGLYWTALRTFTNESPVNSPVPVALIAMRIKATGQLNGVINNFSIVVQRIAKDWNGVAWIEQATRNPGSAFRYALQGNALQNPKLDSEIDLDSIEHLAEVCTANGWTFDQNRDFPSGLWDLLHDIASAGRASPQLINGKYGVVLDEPKDPVTMVTPRNSWGFRASKAFLDMPHAIRVQFNNEDQDWRNDEVRVYLNGYTEDTATLFETMEFPGRTNVDQVVKDVLFSVACAVQRPEQWQFQMEMERLVFKRGDVVLVAHDVLLVGLAQGRIKSLETDGSGNVIAITSDEKLPMITDGNYGLSIRNPNDVAITAQVITEIGEPKTVALLNPILAANAPRIGDLLAFGTLGLETDKAIILGVDPTDNANMSATITCVPYRLEVYSADSGPIPPFNSHLTRLPEIPPVSILSIRSDETVLTLGAGNSLNVNIAVKVRGLEHMDGRLRVQIRPSTTNEPYLDAKVELQSANEIYIGSVRSGEYVDLRFRWEVPGRTPGAWSEQSNYRVVGKTTPPQPLSGLTISTFGNNAYLRWDQPGELDVQFGGSVLFRHSEADPAEWSNSVSIGNAAQANTLFAPLPLKPGTYLARVVDSAGLQSTVVSVNTKQANVLLFNLVDEIFESPDFDGTKTGVIAVDVGGQNRLFLEAVGLFDDIPDLDLYLDDVDVFGGVSTVAGVYEFELGFDFGTVSRMRLTTVIESFNASVYDVIDSWGNIDDREDWDGTQSANCDCLVYVSLTDDDPSGPSSEWSTYERLDSAEVEARGCRFRAILTSNSSDYNIYVGTLGVRAEEVVT